MVLQELVELITIRKNTNQVHQLLAGHPFRICHADRHGNGLARTFDPFDRLCVVVPAGLVGEPQNLNSKKG